MGRRSGNKMTAAIVSALCEKGMTQQELANIIGIRAGTMCNKLSGKTQFTLGEAQTIIDTLDVSPSIFLRKSF